ncbi:unnamed protein product [Schistosoma mattheei]|uniref:Uncharacterized protein n=1 Tax=Schistosoma mattheei TaxID=31246 RepID=A0AA85BYT4_9TREM|nr:unnamed protein product [Schistosoma mattheei]
MHLTHFLVQKDLDNKIRQNLLLLNDEDHLKQLDSVYRTICSLFRCGRVLQLIYEHLIRDLLPVSWVHHCLYTFQEQWDLNPRQGTFRNLTFLDNWADHE